MKWIVRNIPHYSRSLRWIIVLLYTTREHKNKQDNTFCQDLFVFISGLFVFISVTRRQSRSLKTISWVLDLNHGIYRWVLWGKHFRNVGKFSLTTPHDAQMILLPFGNWGQIRSCPVGDVLFIVTVLYRIKKTLLWKSLRFRTQCTWTVAVGNTRTRERHHCRAGSLWPRSWTRHIA